MAPAASIRMWQASQEGAMTEATTPKTATPGVTKTEPGEQPVETFSTRLIRREAERRAALELATTTPAGLESALARISAEVTADAADAKAASDE
jgi:hypothetical protein